MGIVVIFDPRNSDWVAESFWPRSVKAGSIMTAMIAKPTHGSAPIFCEAL